MESTNKQIILKLINCVMFQVQWKGNRVWN